MNNQLVIHVANSSDESAIYGLFASLIDIQERLGLPSLWRSVPKEEIVASIDTSETFVVLEDGELVGTYALEAIDNQGVWPDVENFDAAYLRRLVVHPHQHRQGIGSACLAKAEADAVLSGRTTLRLTADIEHVDVLAFYEHRGYRRCGEAWGPGYVRPDIRFEKALG
jgi:GNAT superfamily N-acetyltransferase